MMATITPADSEMPQYVRIEVFAFFISVTEARRDIRFGTWGLNSSIDLTS